MLCPRRHYFVVHPEKSVDIVFCLIIFSFFLLQVDVQSILDCMGGGNGGVPTVTRAYHEGLCRSVQASFQVVSIAMLH